MEWLVIDALDPEEPQILLEGEKPFIGSYKEAKKYAVENAHYPILVPLSHTLGEDLRDIANYVSMTRFDLGESYDEQNIESEVQKYFL